MRSFTDNVIISEFKLFRILILGGIAVGFVYIGCGFLLDALEPDYPQLIGIIIGAIFALVGSIYLIVLLFLRRYEVDGNKLRIKNILGIIIDEVYLDDIISFSVIKNNAESARGYDVLVLYTADKKVRISSEYISNFLAVKSRLVEGKKHIKHKGLVLPEHMQKGCVASLAVLFMLAGVLVMWGMYARYRSLEPVDPGQLVTITGTIINTPEIKYSRTRRSRSKYIPIQLSQYPKFRFGLSGTEFRAAATKEFVEEVMSGDSIEVDILRSEYQKKILKTKPLSFLEKSINYQSIGIYGLRKADRNYLTLYNYNVANNRDEQFYGIVIFFGIGGFLFTSGIALMFGEKIRAARKKFFRRV